MVSICRLPADGFGKSESEEPDATHEKQDDTYEPHLLSPCSLLVWCADATSLQQYSRDATSEEIAVEIPTVFGARTDISQTALLAFRDIWGYCGGGLYVFTSQCASFEQRKARFLHIFVSAEDRATSTNAFSLLWLISGYYKRNK